MTGLLLQIIRDWKLLQKIVNKGFFSHNDSLENELISTETVMFASLSYSHMFLSYVLLCVT